MNEERLINILLAPVISEKATMLADTKGQFAFKVLRDATKPEIKSSVEKMFNVIV